MSLYLGDKKINANFNGALCNLSLFSANVILNGIKLLSSDNYILKDSNGVYLTAKESE